jgi:hypothetical protein
MGPVTIRDSKTVCTLKIAPHRFYRNQKTAHFWYKIQISKIGKRKPETERFLIDFYLNFKF